MAGSCGKDATTPPFDEATRGTLRITIATSGDDVPPARYTVRVDGDSARALGANDSTIFTGLSAGRHAIHVDFGVPATNCTVNGGTDRNVTVAAGQIVVAAFLVSCVPRVGDLKITAAVTGDDIGSNRFMVSVDGGPGRSVPVNGSFTFEGLHEGTHTVALRGVGDNCVTATNSVSADVSFQQTATVRFTVTCLARVGRIEVLTATTGSDVPTDGYSVSIDGAVARAIGLNDSLMISGVRAGGHSVLLSGVAANCTVVGNNRFIGVSVGQTATVSFAVTCVRTDRVPVIVVTTTSGTDADPDGYMLRMEQGITTTLANIPTNGTVATATLFAGTHTFTLQGVAENCVVRDDATRQAEAVHDATLTFNFDIACTPVTQVAFVRYDQNSSQIYLVNSNGTGVAQLTASGSGEWNSQPAWAPDGKRIAFTSYRGGRSDIYIMNADGSHVVRRTTTGSFNADPAWSPDGRAIAFTSGRENNADVYVMPAEGNDTFAVRLTTSPAYDAQPTWSPDGRRIAFITDRAGYPFDLYVMNADGSEPAMVAPRSATPFYYYSPAWSPDGRTIAVFACPTAHDYDDDCYDGWITLVNADGSGLRKLAQSGGYSKPTWSPDGRTIAFPATTCSPSSCVPSIRYVRADGSYGDVIVTNGYDPAWRP